VGSRVIVPEGSDGDLDPAVAIDIAEQADTGSEMVVRIERSYETAYAFADRDGALHLPVFVEEVHEESALADGRNA
jgi:hypothetical protein